jgi:hypothetical protein
VRAWIGVDRLAATVIAPSGDEVRWIRGYARYLLDLRATLDVEA